MNVDGVTLAILLLLLAGALGLVTGLNRHRRPEASADEHRPESSRTARLRETILIAVWFALMTAVVQLLLAAINRYARGRLLMVSPDIVWLIPAARLVMFALFAAALSVATLVSSRFPSRRVTVICFAWLGVFGSLLPFQQLHQLTAAAIAGGYAAQIARLLDRRPAFYRRVMRTMSPAIVAVVVLAALGMRLWNAASESWAMGQLSTPRPGAPNVLLIVMDTVRAANLSHYGYPRPTTPQLSRWAKEATTFDVALSTAPWTLESHGTMFTGLYPNQFDGDFEHAVDAPVPMLAEIFRDHGYATGGFVANLTYTARESGLARGFVHYDDYQFEPKQLVLHSWLAQTPIFLNLARSRSVSAVVEAFRGFSLDVAPSHFNDHAYRVKTAEELTTSFLAWQGANRRRPFFAFINYFDAHEIYRAPPEFAARFALPGQPGLGRYDGAIAYIDQQIGGLLDELKRRGVLDDTIVIITSDHGEQFGEHSLYSHANSLYLPLPRVPLVIRYPPGIAPDRRVHTPVTLRDLAATVADLADLDPAISIPGVSLALQDGTALLHRSPLTAELDPGTRPPPDSDLPSRFGTMRAVFDGPFHYIRRGDGEEELYDYRQDPDEVRDLADTPEGRERLAAMRDILDGL